MNTNYDAGFVHDIANLDRLRAGIKEDEQGALRAAAQQFESIFTQMLFKSMRQANEAFESDLMSSNTTKFFEQMRDEQMANELSTSGSLGLADLIVNQLGGEQEKPSEDVIRNAVHDSPLRLPTDKNGDKPDKAMLDKAADDAIKVMKAAQARQQNFAPVPPMAAAPIQPSQTFTSPEEFVSKMQPYAEKAASALGTDPAVLIAQAALETGWGKKVIKNAAGSSNNLFNIKADPRWQGPKVATNTLEFHNGIPVQEKAAFRSYDGFQDSFNDYVRFLNDNPRYEKALSSPEDPRQFIRNLHKAGYATDPNYSQKVISVMDKVNSLMK
ncbi:flagellar rod assembly protein/muramidase FlgJ [Photobacterium jeanii]|uniref:Peptidoglycan hydrolase FlgJ n=1 Tax=Photobacterium jeanii TaxID=858640 RepID=A0A178KML6_9GAMM|nr:flagellar assembly peptidoglycan hydrolase FlgJ [Photobacterium jeanii]OAN18628.1 flagellar rod assembly protein/muramidase FlgJ [Photobacterium jeanii]PST91692.1 flagellar assembly peptidoglycan hydrolase FlgJ [Photobacterium jeanii]